MMQSRLLIFILGMFFFAFNTGISQASNDINPSFFLIGKSFGASYYHLIDLNDKSKKTAYIDIREEYQDAFQNLNIADLIIEDFKIDKSISESVKNLRLNLYNALEKQDISETELTITLDKFIACYENLRQLTEEKNSNIDLWLLDLGFYTSFQLVSIQSDNEIKLFLSGFDKILKKNPVNVPENITAALNQIKLSEKPELTTSELKKLKDSLTNITEYFKNSPESKTISNLQDFTGIWQGIFLTPYCEKHDIRLKINKEKDSLTGIMDISNMAQNIPISNIEVIDNYFTLMFKPFGTEKFYIKFDAKESDGIFSGDVTDSVGEKGYWILAKLHNNYISNEKLDTMTSYVKNIESRIKNILPVKNETTDYNQSTGIKPMPLLKDKH